MTKITIIMRELESSLANAGLHHQNRSKIWKVYLERKKSSSEEFIAYYKKSVLSIKNHF